MTTTGKSLAKILMMGMLIVGTLASVKPVRCQSMQLGTLDGNITSGNCRKNLEQRLLAVMSVYQPADQRVQQDDKDGA